MDALADLASMQHQQQIVATESQQQQQGDAVEVAQDSSNNRGKDASQKEEAEIKGNAAGIQKRSLFSLRDSWRRNLSSPSHSND